MARLQNICVLRAKPSPHDVVGLGIGGVLSVGVLDHLFGWLYSTVARLDVGNERGDHARASLDGGNLLIRQDSLIVRLACLAEEYSRRIACKY
ncbi:MAG: hypothetical protein QOJ42_2998 [Acidobacteriaceae bacterium]|jgi:hypothetical protein|nr:hypothetical protein [Acidobacteriaceae bacterium]